jgi:cytidine deaminase
MGDGMEAFEDFQSEEWIQRLIESALKARRYSYSPYSGYQVGAALLTQSYKIYTGCNIEAVSYSPTTCAERVALLKAVSEGERDFLMIAVVGGPAIFDAPTDFAAPCGVCRQFLYEFSPEMIVVMAKSVSDYHVHTLSQLLPYGFKPPDLLRADAGERNTNHPT